MERSGTSLVAQLVHRWGAYAGKNVWRLKTGDQRNPQGYWEDHLLSAFIYDELTVEGPERAALNPHYEAALKSKAGDPHYRRKAERLISHMSQSSDVWFWKEPLLSLQLGFWKYVWGDATYVVTVRNPYDSAVSIQKFTGFGDHPYLVGRFEFIASNLMRWQFYMLSILRHIDASPRKIFICYEDLMNDPRAGCAKLCEFLDGETGRSGGVASRVENMTRAVNTAYWRNRSPVSLSDVDEASEAQRRLYGLLLKKVADPESVFRPQDHLLPPGWRAHIYNYLVYNNFYIDVIRSQAFPLVRSMLAVSRSLAWLAGKARGLGGIPR